MAETTHDVLIDWLKDAYAMEKAAEEIMEKQADRVETYPAVRERIVEHLEETRSQARRVEECINSLDASVSVTKEGVGKLMGNISAMSNAMTGDEVVRNAVSDYTFEQMEMATYRAIMEAAERAGEQDIKAVCQEIYNEEREMAAWLENELPNVANSYLDQIGGSSAQPSR